MGFTKFSALLFIVMSVAGDGWAAPNNAAAPEITVLVHHRAKLARQVLRHAEAEASRIFSAAGVKLRWVDCSDGEVCRHQPRANEFVLNIVPDGKTASDLVYGVAFLDSAGEGKYSDVFFRRIEAASAIGGKNVSRFLGTVAAHELGHLLLGSHAHTHDGIMSAVWKEPVLRRMEMGALLFTSQESVAMRIRVSSQQRSREGPAYTQVRAQPFTD
jgi:hypothetical protein